MAVSAESDDNTGELMSKVFDKAMDMSEGLARSTLSPIDPKYQKQVSEAIEKLEQLTRDVSALSLFSRNETIAEVVTEHLKYLLLPALLGDLTLRSQKNSRIEVIQAAEVYYRDFIARLNDYEICDIKLGKEGHDEEETTGPGSKITVPKDSLITAAEDRNSKIARYLHQKELETKLADMRKLICEHESQGAPIDDELQRRFYLTMLEHWVPKALDELETIKMELPMARMRVSLMTNSNSSGSSGPHRPRPNPSGPKPKPLKPIIITRDQIQKQVIGAGYPSIATVTVDEFINQKINDGSLAFNNEKVYANNLYDYAQNPDKFGNEEEENDQTKEKLLEADDSEHLTRMRSMDDWKDGHKRGEGNRHNMG